MQGKLRPIYFTGPIVGYVTISMLMRPERNLVIRDIFWFFLFTYFDCSQITIIWFPTKYINYKEISQRELKRWRNQQQQTEAINSHCEDKLPQVMKISDYKIASRSKIDTSSINIVVTLLWFTCRQYLFWRRYCFSLSSRYRW